MTEYYHKTLKNHKSSSSTWAGWVRAGWKQGVATLCLAVAITQVLWIQVGTTPEWQSVAETGLVVEPSTQALVPSQSRRHLLQDVPLIPSQIGPVMTRTSPQDDHNEHQWSNDYNVVHVIHTRLLQDYSDSVGHLNAARWYLFQTLCVPSMLQQSNQQYLWMIWMDPQLALLGEDDKVGRLVRDWMQTQPMTSIVVVAANHNDTHVHHNPANQDDNNAPTLRNWYGRSQQDWMESSNLVAFGSTALLESYYHASQTHVLVETVLDADDALSATFVETVQAQAAVYVGHDTRPHSTHVETYCPASHVEWRYYPNPPKNHHDNQNDSLQRGQLVHYHNRNFCIQSGLTVAYHVQAAGRRHLSNCNQHTLQEKCCEPPLRRLAQLEPQPHPHPMSTYPDDPARLRASHQKKSKKQEGLQLIDVRHKDHRSLLGTLDNQAFFDTEAEWRAKIQHCCLDREDFDDPMLLPKLDIQSSSGFGRVWQDAWFDFLAFEYKTTITYSHGIAAMGGHFDLQAIGGAGAGIYVDVKMDGQPAVHIPGQTQGFFGFYSDRLVTTIELTVGHNDNNLPLIGSPLAEAFTIEWLEFAYPPQHACLRRLQPLPAAHEETTHDNWMQSLPAAVLVSRTPTAAGMKHVLPRSDRQGTNSVALTTFDGHQDEAWQYVQRTFGLSAATAMTVHATLQHNLTDILTQALAAQCAPGHSCKASSQHALGVLLDQERLHQQEEEESQHSY